MAAGQNKAECLRMDVKSFQGITEIDYQGIYGYGFYPDKVKGEGFFMSVVRKTALSAVRTTEVRRSLILNPERLTSAVASEWTDFPADRILKRGDEIMAGPSLPEDYFYLFQNLKVVKSGTRIAVRKKNDYIPSSNLRFPPL